MVSPRGVEGIRQLGTGGRPALHDTEALPICLAHRDATLQIAATHATCRYLLSDTQRGLECVLVPTGKFACVKGCRGVFPAHPIRSVRDAALQHKTNSSAKPQHQQREYVWMNVRCKSSGHVWRMHARCSRVKSTYMCDTEMCDPHACADAAAQSHCGCWTITPRLVYESCI